VFDTVLSITIETKLGSWASEVSWDLINTDTNTTVAQHVRGEAIPNTKTVDISQTGGIEFDDAIEAVAEAKYGLFSNLYVK
jgi:hypothetical protein